MSDFLIYGIGGLLICFTIATFLLDKIDAELIPEDYEFQLDPFWYIISVMLVGGVSAFIFFPTLQDTLYSYSLFDVIVPIILAAIIYISYLLGIGWLTNVLTLGAAAIMISVLPSTFRLFPEQLELWQEKIAIILFLFTLSKGFGLLNGLGGIASMQFIAIMLAMVILVYFGALPQILGILALVYAGAMVAFAFFSFPPEKLIMNDGAFCSLGFIVGCLMLFSAVEYAEVSLFIAASYLFTETGLVLYRRYIEKIPCARGFMCTSYFLLSNDGEYEQGVIRGVFKILVIDLVFATIQIAATERLAFPVFTIALNLWLLSILSGDTKPEELLSISRWGKNAIKSALTKQKNNKKSRKK
ncbi:MAG: hypothetical protein NC218_10445 [Acetobacter sp.]|nr:hypothetical protein [Acetobacter sp.]